MANIKSAIKRIDVTRKQTARNKSAKSEIKTYVKKFEEAIANNDSEKANELFIQTCDLEKSPRLEWVDFFILKIFL